MTSCRAPSRGEVELRHRDQQAYQEHFVAFQTALAKADAAKRELEVASHDLRDFESNWITSSTLYRPTMAGSVPLAPALLFHTRSPSSTKQEVTLRALDLLPM
ncbi:hypothetical protein DIPPA_35000 [Diplonema papillatum]|nr:hypothetical protein DIPPA_35000 [Diplonema papillatum]